MAVQPQSAGASNNNYAPPKSRVADVDNDEFVKAGRGARLAAVIVDSLIYFALFLPGFLAIWPAYFASLRNGGSSNEAAVMMLAGAGMWFMISGVLVIGLWVFTGYLVHKNGQTLGKKILGIKVVRSDGSRATLGRIFWLRNVVSILPGMIPFVGGIYSLLDSLLIFRESRQCIHDNIADTIVINA